VAGTLLPLILFAAGVVYLNHMRAREAAFDHVMEVVRGMRFVLDTEMRGLSLGSKSWPVPRPCCAATWTAFAGTPQPSSGNIRASRSRWPPGMAGNC
jgi:hypothetical protein